MGIYITLSIKDRYLERPYNDDKGEYNTLTPFCICIYTSRRPAFVHKQNRSAIFLCSLWVRNFPGFVLGKAKCVNMYAGCFTTDNANITLFFEYSAPRECFYSVG